MNNQLHWLQIVMNTVMETMNIVNNVPATMIIVINQSGAAAPSFVYRQNFCSHNWKKSVKLYIPF